MRNNMAKVAFTSAWESEGQHQRNLQYVGKSNTSLRLRLNKDHQKLQLVTRERHFWLGVIATGNVPGKKTLLTPQALRLAEWALAHFWTFGSTVSYAKRCSLLRLQSLVGRRRAKASPSQTSASSVARPYRLPWPEPPYPLDLVWLAQTTVRHSSQNLRASARSIPNRNRPSWPYRPAP